MPGLNLGVMGGVRASSTGGNVSQAPTATVAQQAFGPGFTQPGTPSVTQALFPNDPFGVSFWAGVAAIVGLVLIRHSLPG